MCLRVTHVPTSKTQGLVVPAWKRTHHLGLKRSTVFTDTIIPDDGWLFPEKRFRRTIFLGQEIGAGVIHSYLDGYWARDAIQAFAFGVEAYETFTSTPLVSRCLYIPSCDIDRHRAARLTEEFDTVWKGRPTTKKLIQVSTKLKFLEKWTPAGI